MQKIIFATGNKDKMREVREIMADMDVEIYSMKEAGIAVDVVEDGTTFEENAVIKAKAIAQHTDAIVLADDSGLEVDYLNKEPGIYSARYLGEDTSYDIKNQMLLDRLAGVPDEKRTARFVCAVAAAFPRGVGSKQDLTVTFQLKQHSARIFVQRDLCGESVECKHGNGVFTCNKMIFDGDHQISFESGIAYRRTVFDHLAVDVKHTIFVGGKADDRIIGK